MPTAACATPKSSTGRQSRGSTIVTPVDIIVVNHDAALAIKVSFPRPQSSGSMRDSDVYGGQQYAPLLDLDVPGRSPARRRRPPLPVVASTSHASELNSCGWRSRIRKVNRSRDICAE
jgi:hypothetical protein